MIAAVPADLLREPDPAPQPALAHRLREEGEDDLHTLDLPDGNRTTDAAQPPATTASS